MLKTSVILNGAAQGSVVDVGPAARVTGIVMPGAWTAAVMTFDVSADNTTFQPLHDDAGVELSFTVTAAKNHGLRRDQSEVLSRWRFIRPRSGTFGAPVNQGADRSVGIAASDLKA